MKLADTLVQGLFDEHDEIVAEDHPCHIAFVAAMEDTCTVDAEYLLSHGYSEEAADTVAAECLVIRLLSDNSVLVNDSEELIGCWVPWSSISEMIMYDPRFTPDAPEPEGSWAQRYMDDTEDMDEEESP